MNLVCLSAESWRKKNLIRLENLTDGKKLKSTHFLFSSSFFKLLFCPPLVLATLLGDPLTEVDVCSIQALVGGPGFGTVQMHQYLNPCTLHQEYRRSLPSKNCPGLMFHTFSILMGSSVYIIFKNLAMIALKPHSNSDYFVFSVTDDQVASCDF